MSNTNNSILTSVKIMLGIPETMTVFDAQILMHINSVLMTLEQLNVGKENFAITGSDETWTDFLESAENLEAVKTYVYLKVRLIFDPPQNSSVANSMNEIAKEFEWRLNINADE